MNEEDLNQSKAAQEEFNREIELRTGLERDIRHLEIEQKKLMDILVQSNPEALRQREKLVEINDRISKTKKTIHDEQTHRKSDFAMIPLSETIGLQQINNPTLGILGESQGESNPEIVYFWPTFEMTQHGSDHGTWVNGENDWWGFTNCELDASGDDYDHFTITQWWHGRLDRSNHYLMSNRMHGNLKLSFHYEMDGTFDNFPDFGGKITVQYAVAFGRFMNLHWYPTTEISKKITYIRKETGNVWESLYLPFPDCSHIYLIGNK